MYSKKLRSVTIQSDRRCGCKKRDNQSQTIAKRGEKADRADRDRNKVSTGFTTTAGGKQAEAQSDQQRTKRRRKPTTV